LWARLRTVQALRRGRDGFRDALRRTLFAMKPVSFRVLTTASALVALAAATVAFGVPQTAATTDPSSSRAVNGSASVQPQASSSRPAASNQGGTPAAGGAVQAQRRMAAQQHPANQPHPAGAAIGSANQNSGAPVKSSQPAVSLEGIAHGGPGVALDQSSDVGNESREPIDPMDASGFAAPSPTTRSRPRQNSTAPQQASNRPDGGAGSRVHNQPSPAASPSNAGDRTGARAESSGGGK
jgi:hypothetical protein